MFRNLLRGRDVQELKELQRQGMSIQAISELTGWDRKTIRKYMQAAGLAPEYGPRSAPPSKLDAFKPYLEERLGAGGWNARVLLRELRKWTGDIWVRWRWPGRSRSCTASPSRWVIAAGWWRKRRWTKSWARCCGCTKPRSSRLAACRKKFSTTA